MNRLGERIRRKREAQDMQLNELARKVGVTPSALSQIENAKAFPSIVTLKSISDSLGTTVGELIGEYESLTRNPIVRGKDKRFVRKNKSGTEQYLLSHHDLAKQMETFMLVFPPGSDAQDFFTEHPGQEFCHLICGELNISLDDNIYKLVPGDSMYYNSAKPHGAFNQSQKIAELLWVTTPM